MTDIAIDAVERGWTLGLGAGVKRPASAAGRVPWGHFRSLRAELDAMGSRGLAAPRAAGVETGRAAPSPTVR